MLLDYLYARTGLNHFHSTDLQDMRRALLDEDEDEDNNGDGDGNEPGGGTADAAAPLAADRRRTPDIIASRRRFRR